MNAKTNKTKSDHLQDIFRAALNKPKLVIRTEAIKTEDVSSAPPAIILLPESARRMQEMMALMQQGTVSFPEDHVLLVNTTHPLMEKLIELDSSQILAGGKSESLDLANLICTHVYDLALMAQKSFDADSMKGFLQRSNQLLTKLTSKI